MIVPEWDAPRRPPRGRPAIASIRLLLTYRSRIIIIAILYTPPPLAVVILLLNKCWELPRIPCPRTRSSMASCRSGSAVLKDAGVHPHLQSPIAFVAGSAGLQSADSSGIRVPVSPPFSPRSTTPRSRPLLLPLPLRSSGQKRSEALFLCSSARCLALAMHRLRRKARGEQSSSLCAGGSPYCFLEARFCRCCSVISLFLLVSRDVWNRLVRSSDCHQTFMFATCAHM